MTYKGKVGIFLVIISILTILFAIFAISSGGTSDAPFSKQEYEENIRVLSDTIKVLREDIAKYRKEIEQIELEREDIKRQLELIVSDNEKTDTELANSDWDTNIKFLTDFLSEEDSVGK